MNRAALGLRAALLLAVGRADGLALLTSVPGEALAATRHSFWAMALALPGFVMLRAVDMPHGAFIHGLAQDLLGYVIGWVGFVLIAHYMAGLGGKAALWPRFVAAWNYCNVVQYMMLMAASLPALLGWPEWLAQTCWLVAMGWAIWLEYFTTRTAMQLSVGRAIGWVLIDFGLGVVVDVAMAAFS